MSLSSNLSFYFRDEDSSEEMTIAIYKHEIEKLGLQNSQLLFPGAHVDARVAARNGEMPRIFFRSKIITSAGKDEHGNEIPMVSGLLYFGQNWDTGGSYLNPEVVGLDDPLFGDFAEDDEEFYE